MNEWVLVVSLPSAAARFGGGHPIIIKHVVRGPGHGWQTLEEAVDFMVMQHEQVFKGAGPDASVLPALMEMAE